MTDVERHHERCNCNDCFQRRKWSEFYGKLPAQKGAKTIKVAERIRTQKKVCPGCKVELPFSKFANNSSAPDGKNYKCRDCHGADMRKYKSRKKAPYLLDE